MQGLGPWRRCRRAVRRLRQNDSLPDPPDELSRPTEVDPNRIRKRSRSRAAVAKNFGSVAFRKFEKRLPVGTLVREPKEPRKLAVAGLSACPADIRLAVLLPSAAIGSPSSPARSS